MAVGADMENLPDAARLDDSGVAAVYKRPAQVVDLNAATVKWQDIARNTAWKDYAARNENSAKPLKLAEKLL